MFGMHLNLVCNMNKLVRIILVYIIVLATVEADEITSKYKTSTTTTKWKEPAVTTKWNEPTTTKWGEPTTTKATPTTNWKQPTTSNSASTANWRQATITKTASTAIWKQPPTIKATSTTYSRQPTNIKAAVTSSWKQPTTTKSIPTNRVSAQVAANHGVVAVASISGVDSRSGRLSSMNGIKIFPPVDSSMVKTDDKGNFVFNSVDGKMPMPITITKQGDGVSGTIQILPGSVSVSSSASSSSKSGPATAAASFNPWPAPFMKPMMNDVYFPPFPAFPNIPDPVFNTRIPDSSYHMRMPDLFPIMRIPEPSFHTQIQDPWFNKDKFKQTLPKHDMFSPNWYYPNYTPFINFW